MYACVTPCLYLSQYAEPVADAITYASCESAVVAGIPDETAVDIMWLSGRWGDEAGRGYLGGGGEELTCLFSRMSLFTFTTTPTHHAKKLAPVPKWHILS